MTNSADPDQLASGSTLFAKAGYIAVQQDSRVNTLIYDFVSNYSMFAGIISLVSSGSRLLSLPARTLLLLELWQNGSLLG